MLKDFDKKKGLLKVTWSEIRETVGKVEPNFTKIVDELSPDKTFSLYLAFYPYGAMDADTRSSLFPNSEGGYYRLSDAETPKDILCDLGYSINNTPLGMVLDKAIESFIDLKDKKITIPWFVHSPGNMFPLTTILNKTSDRTYAPNGLLSSTAGARSVFMLPNIGCSTHHATLQREFNLESSAPKSLYEHWTIFKEIIQHEKLDWHCCVLYFSEKWIKHIHQDNKWSKLKEYLYSIAWQQFQYEINRVQYDMIFSIIQQNRNLKPNPYLADTAKHLFATAIGDVPSFSPALNDLTIPMDFLQKVYIESYGLKKYIPTILAPAHFKLEEESFPIYYSLQNPSTHIFSPKSRKISSTVSEMRELEHIVKIFQRELSKIDSMCSENSILNKVAKTVKFNYFHNKSDGHHIIQPSTNIADLDARFKYYPAEFQNNYSNFSGDSPFVRGCISVSVN